MERYKWYSGCGRLTLSLPKDVVELCYHSGDCTEDLERCMELPEVREELNKLGKEDVVKALEEYSDWNLNSHKINLMRVLWIACGDIKNLIEADTGDASLYMDSHNVKHKLNATNKNVTSIPCSMIHENDRIIFTGEDGRKHILKACYMEGGAGKCGACFFYGRDDECDQMDCYSNDSRLYYKEID